MLRLPHHNRYAYSPIVGRKDYSWPEGRRLAVYLGLNIEHFAFGAGDGPSPDGGRHTTRSTRLSPGAIMATGSACGAAWSCSTSSTCRRRT